MDLGVGSQSLHFPPTFPGFLVAEKAALRYRKTNRRISQSSIRRFLRSKLGVGTAAPAQYVVLLETLRSAFVGRAERSAIMLTTMSRG